MKMWPWLLFHISLEKRSPWGSSLFQRSIVMLKLVYDAHKVRRKAIHSYVLFKPKLTKTNPLPKLKAILKQTRVGEGLAIALSGKEIYKMSLMCL